jgi:hypothetical protein
MLLCGLILAILHLTVLTQKKASDDATRSLNVTSNPTLPACLPIFITHARLPDNTPLIGDLSHPFHSTTQPKHTPPQVLRGPPSRVRSSNRCWPQTS